MADLESMTDEEIRTFIRTMQRGNPTRLEAEILLEARSTERQLRSAERLVVVTENLVTATRRMMWATWALVVLTALTAFAAILSSTVH